MANEVVKVTEVVNTISASISDGSYNLLAGGTIGGPLQLNSTLTVGVDDTGYDVKFFGDAASKFMHWDASEDELKLPDSTKLTFGNSDDLEIYHDGSNSYIADTGTGDLIISGSDDIFFRTAGGQNYAIFNAGGSVDLRYANATKFETTDTGATITGKLICTGDMDVSGTTTTFNSTTVLVEDPILTLGGTDPAGSDDNKDRGIEFHYHDGSSARVGFFGYDDSASAFTFLTAASNSSEVFSGTLGNLKVKTVYFADGTEAAPSVRFNLDSDTGIFRPTANTLAFSTGGTEAARFDSSGKLGLGTTSPNALLHCYSTGNGEIEVERASGALINLQAQAARGVIGTDSNHELQLKTNASARMTISNTGASTFSGAVTVGVDDTGHDVKFFGATASRYLLWDESADALLLADNVSLKLGTSGDGLLYSTNSLIIYDHYNIDVLFRHLQNDKDIIFQTSTGGSQTELLRLDGSASSVNIPDEVEFLLGDNGDLSVKHGPNNSHIKNFAGDFYISNDAANKDLIFRASDGTLNELMRLDGSASTIAIPNDVQLRLGGGNDIRLFSESAMNRIDFYNHNTEIRSIDDDLDVIFKMATGGSTYEIMRLDGSASSVNIPDGVSLNFGASSDFTIKHTGSNTTMLDQGTGALVIATNQLKVLSANQAETLIKATEDSEVELYHNGSKKFETTSTGVEVTGNLRLGDGTQRNIIGPTNENLGIFANPNGADEGILFSTDNGTTTEMMILNGGNVGIGTTSPLNSFQISEYTVGSNGSQSVSGTASIFADSGDDALYLGLKNGSYPNRGYSFQTVANGVNSDFVIKEHGQTGERLRIASSGNVGINTTAPSSLLDVRGTVQVGVDGTGHDVFFYGDTAGKYLKWDESEDTLFFPDNTNITFGSGNDATIGVSSDNLVITNTTADKDIVFQCDDGSGGSEIYFYLDGSASSGDPFTVFPDNSQIAFGDSRDLRIDHNGTDSFIQNYVGNLVFRNYTDDGDIEFHCDNGSGGTETYFYLDGSLSGGNPYTVFPDNARLSIGTGADLTIFHTGSHSNIANAVGDLIFTQSTNDGDIIFKSDDGSGGDAEYFRLDGGLGYSVASKQIRFDDNVPVYFGNGNDVAIWHDGTDTKFNNYTGDLYIQNGADDKDIIFQCDDGSGGVETYFYLDGSMNTDTTAKTVFPDNSKLQFGSGSSDLRIYHDTTDSHIESKTGTLIISNNVDNADIRLQASSGSSSAVDYIILDSSQGSIRMKRQTKWDDNILATFGDGEDLQIKHDGSNSYINQTGTGDLHIRQTIADQDIFLSADNGSGTATTYIQLDGGNTLTYFAVPTKHGDDKIAGFGTDNDLQIKHTSDNSYIENNTGHLYITNTTDDADIIFRSDNGSGGIAEYFRLDGGFGGAGYPTTIFPNDSSLRFGNSGNLQIINNGTDSYIQENNGDLYIRQSADDKDIIFQSDDGSGGVATYFYLDGSYGGVVFNRTATWTDSDRVELGTGSDFQLTHDGTHSYITNNTGSLFIGNSADDMDIVFSCDDGSGGTETYFFLDGSASSGDPNTVFPDNSKLTFGNDYDLRIQHASGNSSGYIQNYTGDLYIENFADDKDIVFKADDGSGGTETYFYLDGSKSSGNPYTIFPDNSYLGLGDDANLILYHTGSASVLANNVGDLYIEQNTNDGNLLFKCDDGSGGTSTYMSLDGGRETVNFARGVELPLTAPNNTDYTVTSADYCVLMHSLSTTRTVTIPTAQRNAGRVLVIKERDGYASSYNITIATEGSETIDGSATATISADKGSLTLISDGSNWFII